MTMAKRFAAPRIKKFFKDAFGIPVRVKSIGKDWIEIWIISDRSPEYLHQLKYDYDFPEELGRRCMQIVYSGSEKLSQQTWCANISSHSIALTRPHFDQLMKNLADNPIES